MHITVQQILRSINNSDELLRTLAPLTLQREESGAIKYRVGNSAVIFTILLNDEWHLMKCYTSPNRHLKAIYGERLLERELYIMIDNIRGVWIDVVIDKWREGVELSGLLSRLTSQGDTPSLMRLSYQFDAFALRLLESEWAHGDITTDNIIVDENLELHLIDFDGSYIPQLEGSQSIEVGTLAYQHPARRASDFNRHIDDYSLALISTALALLTLEPSLLSTYGDLDGLLFDPAQIAKGQSEIYTYALDTLSKAGDAPAYCIAKMLTSLSMQLPHLQSVLEFKVLRTNNNPTLSFRSGALWGYSNDSQQDVIPPLYNEAFDFSEDRAAVKIGNYWHYITSTGSLALNCSRYIAIKPRRNGHYRLLTDSGWITLP